jgi:hypothetical protein
VCSRPLLVAFRPSTLSLSQIDPTTYYTLTEFKETQKYARTKFQQYVHESNSIDKKCIYPLDPPLSLSCIPTPCLLDGMVSNTIMVD